MIFDVIHPDDIQRVRSFLARFDLAFEDNYDDLIVSTDNNIIIGVGARSGRVLKMIAVDPHYQSGDVFSDLVTTLTQKGYQSGIENFFVFTKPAFYHSFKSLNFKLLYSASHVALLEYGKGINRYLCQYSKAAAGEKNGGIVVNGNPFTLGHRYLIEQSLKQCDNLYVFVVEEDASSFPFQTRFELIKKGVADLENVFVLPTGPYAVSQITFPNYFLKDQNLASDQQIEIDLHLFGKFVAPYFSIQQRFIGTEPYCETTAAYNRCMKKKLQEYNIDVVEFPRKNHNNETISASKVRDLLRKNQMDQLNKLLPKTTLDFIHSEAFKQHWLFTNESKRH